jgi:hypothetical protein
MKHPPNEDEPLTGGEVVDFDEALLDHCPAEELRDLMTEANLIAEVFAPRQRPREIARLAETVQSGVKELDFGRARARRLAAALRRLARRAA